MQMMHATSFVKGAPDRVRQTNLKAGNPASCGTSSLESSPSDYEVTHTACGDTHPAYLGLSPPQLYHYGVHNRAVVLSGRERWRSPALGGEGVQPPLIPSPLITSDQLIMADVKKFNQMYEYLLIQRLNTQ
jgi:hypothetical protein